MPPPPYFETPRIAVLPHVSQSAFEAIIRIYEEAIPAAERRTSAGLARTFDDPRYRVIAAWVGAKLAGFAVVYAGAAVCLLEYMAVEKGLRDRGLGSLLCRAAERVADGLAPKRPLFAEVDADDVEAPDLDLRLRRKAFYARHGFKELSGFRYILPLPNAEQMGTMQILAYGLPGGAVRSADVRRSIVEIYTEVYRKDVGDPRIDQMMRGIGDQILLI